MTRSLDAHVVLRRGALDLDVRLQVDAGEVLAVLGPNGAGKTSLLLALAGLLPLSGGRVVLGGRTLEDPAERISVPTAQRGVGYLPQRALLFEHLSVRDNVAFGPRSQGVGRRRSAADADRLLASVGLGEWGDRRAGDLSGGQAQRVGLLRALAVSPDLLLLDEPTASVDREAVGAVREAIGAVVSGRDGRVGPPVVMVTHDPAEALAHADRVLVLEAGAVLQTGRPVDVVSRPATPFVARWAGVTVLGGVATDHEVAIDGGGALTVGEPHRGRVEVLVPPGAVALYPEEPHGSPRNVWPVTVVGAQRVGDLIRVTCEGVPSVAADLTLAASAEIGAAPGARLWASVKASELRCVPA